MMEIKTRYLPPGTILGDRYVVGKVIGQGSFGITYIGRDTLFDDVVAVKEYFPAHHVFRNVTGDEGIKVCRNVLLLHGRLHGCRNFAKNKNAVVFCSSGETYCRWSYIWSRRII